jgi:predicted phosphodiesterase
MCAPIKTDWKSASFQASVVVAFTVVRLRIPFGDFVLSNTETILVIPDAHATPGIPNDRFRRLGNYIVHMKPDLVLCLGDFAHMGSLSEFDKGTVKAHGQYYEADIRVSIDANEQLWKPLHQHNKALLRSGSAPYNPRKVMLYGNHEFRIMRAASKNPELWNWITVDDLEYEKFGWETVPFKTIFNYNDILFAHFFTDGLKDMSIGGVNAARRLTMQDARTRIMGHSHTLQFSYTGRGRKRFGLVAGCYFDHVEDYLSPEAQEDWWRGVVWLDRVTKDGQCDPYFIPMSAIQERYDF